ncbi:anthranilate synthase component II [Porphyromonas sp. COT-108 OH2963]|uniref:anthranilate synthase component II n=1 Tax=Porphyromonas sp. COT-108 OH2963 TaxID=1515614 RepID=UPI000689D298|nr:aminodeoxychorismate/anthranilate synthase component II [Porphyromonas sp. COT-108 OH2963]
MKQIRVLIINHHDSFVYNLVQIVRESGICDYTIVNEEDLSSSWHLFSTHTHILLSPGPGLPQEYDRLLEVIRTFAPTHSILGVCLGLQAMVLALGGKLECLTSPKHGHTGILQILNKDSLLLAHLDLPIGVGRYHSWVAAKESLPKYFSVDALDDEGNIAVLSHAKFKIWGVQFHPESIMTPQGRKMVEAWLQS